MKKQPEVIWQVIKPFIKRTGFFYCNRDFLSDQMSHIEVQRGVVRTNCIDSLDRTNEA